jgi:hypothetical protein
VHFPGFTRPMTNLTVGLLLVVGCVGCANTSITHHTIIDCARGFTYPPGRTDICVPDS